ISRDLQIRVGERFDAEGLAHEALEALGGGDGFEAREELRGIGREAVVQVGGAQVDGEKDVADQRLREPAGNGSPLRFGDSAVMPTSRLGAPGAPQSVSTTSWASADAGISRRVARRSCGTGMAPESGRAAPPPRETLRQ